MAAYGGSEQRSSRKAARWIVPAAVGIFALLVGFSAGEASGEKRAQEDLDAAWSENYELQDQLESSEQQIEQLQEQLSGLGADGSTGSGTSDPLDPYSLDPWGYGGATTYEGYIPGTGEFFVGVDIASGTYRTEGGQGCTWMLVGADLNQVDQQFSTGPAEITLTDQDFLFTTSGCAEWQQQG